MASEDAMIHIGFEDVFRLASVESLVEPLRQAFAAEAHCPGRIHHDLGPPSSPRALLLMPSWRTEGDIGVKIVTVFPDNAKRGLPSVNAAYLLLSGLTGQPQAWIDGRALTLIRTAAVSALAALLYAPPDPQVLLMAGTGALSRHLIGGHRAARSYRSILIWGRDPQKAARVAGELAARGWPVAAADDLEAAARSADVISCATLAEQPLIRGAWLKSCSHLDLVGSYKPAMREADDDCIRGAGIVVDTLAALRDSGDLAAPLAHGVIRAEDIVTLRERAAHTDLAPRAARTVFKSVGVAHADLAVAIEILARHRQSLPDKEARSPL